MFAHFIFALLRAAPSLQVKRAFLSALSSVSFDSQSRSKTVISLTLITLVMTMSGCDHAQPVSKPPSAKSKPSANSLKNDASQRVVSPDWGNAATLTAMGYPPVATGDVRLWDRWVDTPSLPPDIVDLGGRYQPNAELVAQLPIDMVIDNPFYVHARRLYGDVPTESVMFSASGKVATWADYTEPTRTLGRLIGQPTAAEAYIKQSKQDMEQAGAQLQARYPHVNKFAVVQFSDANNVRMYVNNSLFKPAFAAMSKELVVLGEGNNYGFVSKRVGDLAALDDDVCLLIVDPLSPITRAEMKDSLIWQRLGYGQTRCIGELTPIWIYGGMSSLVSLANQLSTVQLQGGAAS